MSFLNRVSRNQSLEWDLHMADRSQKDYLERAITAIKL